MYDQYFDTADEYTTEEVLRRAYALGVASVCGNPDDAAYQRLKERSPDAYDESIVELAYEEGRAEALELEAEHDTDGAETWEQLVETTIEPPGSDEGAATEDPEPELLSRREKRDPVPGLPESIELPSFLRR